VELDSAGAGDSLPADGFTAACCVAGCTAGGPAFAVTAGGVVTVAEKGLAAVTAAAAPVLV
jgi:hypothetical protein